jgi:NAD(P)-dependent dehydrogenase (short-subunit alcohol dehydrogenase family)
MERQNEASLDGKVAIVTGSSRGIGKQAALALAQRGARLVVTARTVEASGSELPGTIGQTVKEIESLGGEAVAVAADLSNEQDLEQIVGTAIDRFDGVDILVNNAAVTVGYNWSAPLLEMPRADWLHHFAVNLHAPFTLAQRCVPSMEARGGGRIINVTTGSAEAHRLVEEPNPASSIKYYSGDASGGIPAPGASMNIPALWSPAYFASKRALDRFSNLLLLLHVHGGPRHRGGRARLRALSLRHPSRRPAADRGRPGQLARVRERGGGQDRPHAQQPHRLRCRAAPLSRLPPGPP